MNALIEEKLLKIDELARNVDRISLDVDSLKLRSIPPKHDINESLKAMRISIDECKERTARMHAKKYCFVKASSSSFHDNNDDEDLKVIDVTPIKSLFSNMNLDKDGTRDVSTLVKRSPNDSEFLDLDAKINKSVSSNPNDMPLSTLSENNNESMDVNFVGRNNFGNNAYRGNFNSRSFPSNSSNNYGNSYNKSYGNFNKMPSDFVISVKVFMSSQKNFNTLVEEKLLKIDELARNVDIISLDVDSLKLRSIPPNHGINKSLKAMRISIDECKERTARMRAKKDCFVKACSSSSHDNNDEDL